HKPNQKLYKQSGKMAKTETVAVEITKPPYKLSPEQVAQELETNLETGLTDVQAKHKLDKYGPNKLDGGEGVAVWEVLFKQVCLDCIFSSPNVPSRCAKFDSQIASPTMPSASLAIRTDCAIAPMEKKILQF